MYRDKRRPPQQPWEPAGAFQEDPGGPEGTAAWETAALPVAIRTDGPHRTTETELSQGVHTHAFSFSSKNDVGPPGPGLRPTMSQNLGRPAAPAPDRRSSRAAEGGAVSSAVSRGGLPQDLTAAPCSHHFSSPASPVTCPVGGATESPCVVPPAPPNSPVHSQLLRGAPAHTHTRSRTRVQPTCEHALTPAHTQAHVHVCTHAHTHMVAQRCAGGCCPASSGSRTGSAVTATLGPPQWVWRRNTQAPHFCSSAPPRTVPAPRSTLSWLPSQGSAAAVPTGSSRRQRTDPRGLRGRTTASRPQTGCSTRPALTKPTGKSSRHSAAHVEAGRRAQAEP